MQEFGDVLLATVRAEELPRLRSPAWGSHTLIVNNAFIHRYNFNEARGVNLHGTTAWAHDPAHRMGVPYANPALRTEYRASVRSNLAAPAERMPAQNRSSGEPTERMGD